MLFAQVIVFSEQGNNTQLNHSKKTQLTQNGHSWFIKDSVDPKLGQNLLSWLRIDFKRIKPESTEYILSVGPLWVNWVFSFANYMIM